MHEPIFIFRDVAMVFAAAFVVGLLFWRLRQPVILGYVLAGLILSPLTPGPRIHDVHVFQVMAEVGVILLMFSVGIEFSIPELLRVKWVALIGAPIGIALCIGLGIGTGMLLHWPLPQSIAVGCIISVASTMVLMRLLMDRGELASESARIMLTLTLVEDLAVVILTVLLPSLATSGETDYLGILWKVAKALLLLIPVIFAGWKIVPRLLSHVGRIGNEEISLLLVLTICMVMAAVTELVGLSLALGAFVGGMLMGSCEYAHRLGEKTLPLRDAFVALFFVTVGMLIDPSTLVANWRLLAVMVGLILVGKFAIWFTVVLLFGYRARTAFRVGIALTQIGEFSFILAQISLQAGLIASDVYNATLAASLVTILVNATLFKLVGRVKPLNAEKRPSASPEQQNPAAGTGIGLSIVKKAADAHHGHAWVISDEKEGTTFYMSLPSGTGRTA